MHIAVARNKFAPGVDAPGVRWGKWTPEMGEPTYDWRERPRSAGNTRGVYCAYAVGDRELLLEESQTDDHLVQYYVVDPAGSVLRRQPRIRKGGLPWVLSLGYAVEVDVLFADVDNPGHSDWTPRLLDRFREQLRTVEALQTCGYYTTSHGARLFQDLDEPVPASESERYLFVWLSELEASGVGVDWGCRDWTRHFRLPYVRRAGVPTKPTLISVASSPRTIRPGPVAVKSIPTPRGRASKRRVVGRCAAALPETWTDRAVRLGAALVPFTEGSNHELSLCLAGALLERGVSPEAVPAVVVSAANAAGWRGRAADHHWRNAEDTVMKWATGARVRTDVPPSLVPVLDEVCQVPPAPEASPEVEADKLRRAIAGTADGLTVVRVACGSGKTRAARLIAAERAAQGLRTTISVPTNELALQVVSDLREAGVAVARYFGPTSLTGDGACRFRGAAAAIAHGQQSVRWELCEGRGKEPCPYLDGCQATVGAEGPDEVLVVVGNHGLLGELEAATGKRGLLIVDEPPDVLEDLDVTARDLALAKAQLGKFEEPQKLAPAIALAEAYLKEGRLDEPVNLAEVDLDVPSLGDLLAAAQAEDVQTAIASTVKRGARAPALVRWQVAVARSDDDAAKRLGEASATMALLYRALTDESVRVTAYEDYATRERRLSVASVEPRLKAALRRDGRVVAMAADAHLHLPAYREVVCYEPTYVEVSAKDGCQVRRVLLERAFGRRPTPKRAEADAAAVRRALDLAVEGHGAGAKVAVVTFKAREAEVAAVARAWASERPDGIVLDGHVTVVLDVAHYGALRGLDRWKHYDALVTVGDPVPNLSAVSRTLGEGEDVLARARDLARAELEQAHGRLRTVHRDTKCTVVHVGRCVAYGWPPGFESATVVERAAHVDVAALVMACGGFRASSRLCGVSPTSVKRWVEGTWDPPTNAVALLQAAVAEGRSGTGRRRRGAKGSG